MRLIEAIKVQPALELVGVERFSCGTLQVGQECLIFSATIRKYARVERTGQLEVIFRDASGKKVATPNGVQLTQRMLPFVERRPIGTVSIPEWTQAVTVEVFLISYGIQPAEIGSVELVFRES